MSTWTRNDLPPAPDELPGVATGYVQPIFDFISEYQDEVLAHLNAHHLKDSAWIGESLLNQARTIADLQRERDAAVARAKKSEQLIPAYAMLDVWVSLGRDSIHFDDWYDERGYADAWAELTAAVREGRDDLDAARENAEHYQAMFDATERQRDEAQMERADALRERDAAASRAEQAERAVAETTKTVADVERRLGEIRALHADTVATQRRIEARHALAGTRAEAAEERHTWPKTTPTGHTYIAPDTYAALCHQHGNAAQAAIESWEADECPQEPTWEMVGVAHREVERIRRDLDEWKDRADQLRDERDEAVADLLDAGRVRDEWEARAEKAEADRENIAEEFADFRVEVVAEAVKYRESHAPTTEDVKQRWLEAHRVPASLGSEQIGHLRQQRLAEFDVWLAKVKADARDAARHTHGGHAVTGMEHAIEGAVDVLNLAGAHCGECGREPGESLSECPSCERHIGDCAAYLADAGLLATAPLREAYVVATWKHTRWVTDHAPDPGEPMLRGSHGADALHTECAVCREVLLPARFERLTVDRAEGDGRADQ